MMRRHTGRSNTAAELTELSSAKSRAAGPRFADAGATRFTLGVVTDVTGGIRVSVETRYIEDQSDAADDRYAFAYHIVISNESERTVQLMRRHWYIEEDGGQTREVEGPGVIGEQPVIKPGESHSYTSGAILAMPNGSMRGFYQMTAESGESLRVRIPEFSLKTPRTLH
jgi:ApaG protein